MQNVQEQSQLTDSQWLVVGLGASGQSMLQFLWQRDVPPTRVTVADSRISPPAAELPDGTVLHTGSLPVELLAGVDVVLVSPGVDLRQPLFVDAQRQQIPVIGDIELFAAYANAPIVAITGSNGKSTTVTLLHKMALACGLDARLGGNIGTPALQLLQADEPDVYILELSSFQLESTYNLQLAAAAVLNVSADHMDRYDSLSSYAAAKARIFEHAQVAVINADDAWVRSMPVAEVEGAACIGFTHNPPNGNAYGLIREADDVWLAHHVYADNQNEKLMPASALKVAGLPNQLNALAAIALADAMGWSRQQFLPAVAEFSGLSHRMQWIAELNGVRYFNDSKGTNVGATLAAIEGLDESVVLIAGGQAKGGDFAPLRTALAERGRAVVLIGEDAALIAEALDGSVAVSMAESMTDAVVMAQQLARPGDAVVLSPACASFDMFAGFADRGEQFVAAVQQLQEAA